MITEMGKKGKDKGRYQLLAYVSCMLNIVYVNPQRHFIILPKSLERIKQVKRVDKKIWNCYQNHHQITQNLKPTSTANVSQRKTKIQLFYHLN